MGSGNSKVVTSTSNAVLDQKGNVARNPEQESTSSSTTASVEDPKNETATSSSNSRNDGCPMHRGDGTYSYDWRAMLRAGFPHGPGGSKPLKEEQARAKVGTTMSESSPLVVVAAQEPRGGCPVKQSSAAAAAASQQEQEAGGCPDQRQKQPEYNVYAQPLDPTNNMPSNPNQLPAPTQSTPLSTERVASTIPKGGAAAKGSTWTYPSPQMFYNALARKGKLDDTVEEDIESVVALHNNMNEKTWKKVLEWEETVSGSDEAPKLLKFQGRPTDLSPKAAFKHYVLGHPLPYDRHDWTVERADGTTVRYVIDYYHDESRARDDPDSALPDIQDATASSSLLVDVRPAADGPAQVWNRVATMPYARRVAGNATFEPLPMLPPSTMQSQVKESVAVWQSIQAAAAAKQKTRGDNNNNNPLSESMSEAQAKELAQNFATMLTNCRKAQAAVVECETEAECARVSIDLTLCMGQNVCPLQHEALIKFLSADDDGAIEDALTRVNECVTLKTQQHALAKEKYPKVFQ